MNFQKRLRKNGQMEKEKKGKKVVYRVASGDKLTEATKNHVNGKLRKEKYTLNYDPKPH